MTPSLLRLTLVYLLMRPVKAVRAWRFRAAVPAAVLGGVPAEDDQPAAVWRSPVRVALDYLGTGVVLAVLAGLVVLCLAAGAALGAAVVEVHGDASHAPTTSPRAHAAAVPTPAVAVPTRQCWTEGKPAAEGGAERVCGGAAPAGSLDVTGWPTAVFPRDASVGTAVWTADGVATWTGRGWSLCPSGWSDVQCGA